MASRRKFSDEYKREAVRLATEPGVTKSQVAGELGINANLLGRWCGKRCLFCLSAVPKTRLEIPIRHERSASVSRNLKKLNTWKDSSWTCTRG